MFVSVIRICVNIQTGQELNAEHLGQEHESREKACERNSIKISSVV
jgi:hypothetical protein